VDWISILALFNKVACFFKKIKEHEPLSKIKKYKQTTHFVLTMALKA
jgi:hypothetical protein